MKKYFIKGMAALCFLCGSGAYATGITADAGLTPAKDRWVIRSQVRTMHMTGPGSGHMNSVMVPVMAAYGILPQFMVMGKAAGVFKSMGMQNGSDPETGLADMVLLMKYRLYRHNTSAYTLGIAPTLGIEAPTGTGPFTSDTWDLLSGLYLSGRTGAWGVDAAFSWKWNGIEDPSTGPGHDVSAVTALSKQFSLDGESMYTLAPVAEAGYDIQAAGRAASSDFFTVSAGAKFAASFYILEGLCRVSAGAEGPGASSWWGGLMGVRLLF